MRVNVYVLDIPIYDIRVFPKFMLFHTILEAQQPEYISGLSCSQVEDSHCNHYLCF